MPSTLARRIPPTARTLPYSRESRDSCSLSVPGRVIATAALSKISASSAGSMTAMYTIRLSFSRYRGTGHLTTNLNLFEGCLKAKVIVAGDIIYARRSGPRFVRFVITVGLRLDLPYTATGLDGLDQLFLGLGHIGRPVRREVLAKGLNVAWLVLPRKPFELMENPV